MRWGWRSGWALAGLVASASCGDGTAPRKAVPAQIAIIAVPAASVTVGASAGMFTVRVTDAQGGAVSGTPVTFTLSLGGGTLSRLVDTTAADGSAETSYVARTTPGANEISATIAGLAPVRSNVATVAGPTESLALNTRSLRLAVGRDVGVIPVVGSDHFGNPTGDTVVWIPRDSSLVRAVTAANHTVTLTVQRRPGQTWVVAASGTLSDSALVSIPDAAAPCAFADPPTTLPVGGVLDFGGATCIAADAVGGEYALVANFNTAVTQSTTTVEVTATPVTAPTAVFPSEGSAASRDDRNWEFEEAMRRQESGLMADRVAGARAWYDSRPPALSAQPREGDRIDLNVNARDFCSHPDLRRARIVAITTGAVIMADTANPEGGFSDEEYRAFGVAVDTLVNPVDTAAFGAPTDIDRNGRVAIFFTQAVNELTPNGSPGGVVLGFYYQRDLLPKTSPFGGCEGSNVGEMFYVMVPDPAGSVNGNQRAKSLVQSIAMSTVGHEYQHLINASRRMYLNDAPQVEEEAWLNEGLSHIAEELLFYRASGRSPRENIDATSLAAGTATRVMFDSYQRNNMARYREYLRAPETTSPLSVDDRLVTRGASWSFLRYVADRLRTSDGDIWRRLVNSRTTGALNLADVLDDAGVTPLEMLHDWSISVLTDESAAGGTAAFRQPSWNFASVLPMVGLSFALTPRILTSGVPISTILQGGGSLYFRFALPPNQESFVQVTGFTGARLPTGMRVAIVRIK